MHNCGTSLAASLMQSAGVPLGDRLLLRKDIPEEQRPRYDYYEDADVVALQERTLLELKRHWSSFRASFPLPEADHPERQRFRLELSELIETRLRRHALWLVKDPRTALLLEDWLAVLGQLGVQVRLLVVHRDPATNRRSFSSKGQVPALWAEALWQTTYGQALRSAATLPREQVCFCDFNQLQSQPCSETERLCRFLGWSVHHHRLAKADQRRDASLPTQQQQPSDPTSVHPWSRCLHDRLQQGLVGEPARPENLTTLAEAMEQALCRDGAPLELNAHLGDGQSLQPKLRVAIVTAELQGWGPSGGIGSAYLELARALVDAGHAVHVLLVRKGSEAGEAIQGLTVEWIDPSGLSRLQLQRQLNHRLRRMDADVVHVHDWQGLASGLKEQPDAESPLLIVGLHGPSAWVRSGNQWPTSPDGGLLAAPDELMEEGLIRALEHDALAQADLVVSPSVYLADWLRRQQPELRGSLWVERNCPLSARLQPSQADGAEQEAAEVAPCPCDLVYFGRLERRKGVLLFVEALERMELRPRRVLMLGGDVPLADGTSAAAAVEQRLRACHIDTQFMADCNQQQALELLATLQPVVCIPSLIENSPCTVEELLNSGLRLVVTNVGGIPELVPPSQHHWLSDPEPEALSRHLEAALTAGPSDAYRLGTAIENWSIVLSWQALHERLPRRRRA